MLIFLWTFLAVSVYLTFIFLCFKSIGLIKRELGTGAAVVFTIGLLSTCSRQNETTNSSSSKISDRQVADNLLLNKLSHKDVVIENNLMFSINMVATYGEDTTDNLIVPLSAKTYVNGVTGPVRWVPSSANVYLDPSGSGIRYDIYGAIEWRLLNLPLITQSKNYQGIIDIGPETDKVK